jgi:hypothetical protein
MGKDILKHGKTYAFESIYWYLHRLFFPIINSKTSLFIDQLFYL